MKFATLNSETVILVVANPVFLSSQVIPGFVLRGGLFFLLTGGVGGWIGKGFGVASWGQLVAECSFFLCSWWQKCSDVLLTEAMALLLRTRVF